MSVIPAASSLFPTAQGQTSVGPSSSDQWLRKIELLVYDTSTGAGSGGQSAAMNLTPDPQTQLQVVFSVKKSTSQSPNLLIARIFNLAPNTVNQILNYKKIQLSAGYRNGRYGVIFSGTVVQYRRGKENPTDTYLEIYAGNGDQAQVTDTVTGVAEAGTPIVQVIKDQLGQMKGSNSEPISVGDVDAGPYGETKLLRRMVYCRNGFMALRDHANGANADWYVDDNKHNFIQRNKYRSGEAAVLSSTTGLVGIPEVTPLGIQARCLLNPDLKLGGLVKIDTKILSGVPFTPGSETKVDSSGNPIPNPGLGGIVSSDAMWKVPLISSFTSPTGTYKILLLEHHGETRGNPWYSELVCVALNESGNAIPSWGLPYQRSIVVLPTPAG